MADCGGKPGSSRRCGIPLARGGGRAAQFAPCLHDDLATARNAKAGQHQGDDEIGPGGAGAEYAGRSEEHTSELQSLMRISYAVFCLKKKKNNEQTTPPYPTSNLRLDAK